MVSISDVPSIKYWKNLVKVLDTAEANIPKKFRMDDTCFMPLETIGVNLYTIKPNCFNNVYKGVDDLL